MCSAWDSAACRGAPAAADAVPLVSPLGRFMLIDCSALSHSALAEARQQRALLQQRETGAIELARAVEAANAEAQQVGCYVDNQSALP